MNRTIAEIAVLAVVGICFWLLICLMGDTAEPWDASFYWQVAYPLSIVLAGAIGFRMGYRGWIAGIVLTLAQFPVMIVLGNPDQMAFFGFLLLLALAGPAAIVSAICGRIGLKVRLQQ